ncbi:hypothetical protein [Paraburkholderia sp.]|uniref:hypothetical protein n=1 Tax=Paraburkholderia sp. TaxID=1926495 RepID=UPI00238397F1|nr:hypothetical protein [Paraburkholderia sp.]MDE1184527.1 hypothetical protein [Paraburkholderia sp.]
MQFRYKTFHINCTPRAADGEYFARATVTPHAVKDDRPGKTHQSGDLAVFSSKDDAVAFAHTWAVQWCNSQER